MPIFAEASWRDGLRPSVRVGIHARVTPERRAVTGCAPMAKRATRSEHFQAASPIPQTGDGHLKASCDLMPARFGENFSRGWRRTVHGMQPGSPALRAVRQQGRLCEGERPSQIQLHAVCPRQGSPRPPRAVQLQRRSAIAAAEQRRPASPSAAPAFGGPGYDRRVCVARVRPGSAGRTGSEGVHTARRFLRAMGRVPARPGNK